MPSRRAISAAVIGSARYIAATCASETVGPAGGRCPGRPAAVSHRDTVCGCTRYRAASSPRESRSRSRRRRSSAAGGGGLRTLPGRWAPSRPPPGRIGMLSSNSHVRTRCVVEFSRSATAVNRQTVLHVQLPQPVTGGPLHRGQRPPGSVLQRPGRRREPGLGEPPPHGAGTDPQPLRDLGSRQTTAEFGQFLPGRGNELTPVSAGTARANLQSPPPAATAAPSATRPGSEPADQPSTIARPHTTGAASPVPGHPRRTSARRVRRSPRQQPKDRGAHSATEIQPARPPARKRTN